MNTSTLGSQTEAIILAALVKDGFIVYVPFGGHHRCDYIIDNGFGLIKVQCKTGRIRDGVLKWATSTTDKVWSTKEISRKSYIDEVDVFLVYCPDVDKIWSVPVNSVPENRGTLRIEPCKNNQRVGVKWAADYEGLSDLSLAGKT